MKALAVIVLLGIFSAAQAYYCEYYDSFDTLKHKYCSYGCCGGFHPTSYTACCTTYITTTVNIGTIAGAVVGSIISLAVFIAIIVIICRRRRATVIYSNGGCGPTVSTVTTTAHPAPYSTY
ncbi:hypothetical protein SNE40_013991 [Patella caerulea]|uniref:Cysteine and tyrosine-rich protein 1 n=1 Tax=Patella caerulea TaxID=87958 RepID=A0AAN8JH22_PATCE